MPGPQNNGATVGFEEKLWAAADKMRGHLDPAEYKHVALGLIFLKYISDSFGELHGKLVAQAEAEWKEAAADAAAHDKDPETLRESWTAATDPEDRDEYTAENVFWVPRRRAGRTCRTTPSSRPSASSSTTPWTPSSGTTPACKRRAAQALRAPRPRQAPPRRAHRPDRHDRHGRRGVAVQGLLGRVYEYFLGSFASAEGKGGGEFYTARCVVKLLVAMIEPLHGRVYDPCCGSGGMFVQSETLRRGPRRPQGRHLDLRAGEQPHDLAAGQDEPRHPRASTATWARSRPTPSTTTCTRT